MVLRSGFAEHVPENRRLAARAENHDVDVAVVVEILEDHAAADESDVLQVAAESVTLTNFPSPVFAAAPDGA